MLFRSRLGRRRTVRLPCGRYRTGESRPNRFVPSGRHNGAGAHRRWRRWRSGADRGNGGGQLREIEYAERCCGTPRRQMLRPNPGVGGQLAIAEPLLQLPAGHGSAGLLIAQVIPLICHSFLARPIAQRPRCVSMARWLFRFVGFIFWRDRKFVTRRNQPLLPTRARILAEQSETCNEMLAASNAASGRQKPLTPGSAPLSTRARAENLLICVHSCSRDLARLTKGAKSEEDSNLQIGRAHV